MEPQIKTGFTIIETMLFLAISGVLIAGLLVGVGSSINVQRYRDSVTSLRSFLQQQYSDVLNVSNDSIKNDCYGDNATDVRRGQSNCVILGRYITTSAAGDSLTSKMVIGYRDPASLPPENEIKAIEQYQIKASSIPGITYTVDWGASIVDTENATTKLSMLILRSPSNGVIRTFIDNTQVLLDFKINELLKIDSAIPPSAVPTIPDSLETSAKLCVESGGLFSSVGKKMAVFVQKNATSASDVNTEGEETSGCK